MVDHIADRSRDFGTADRSVAGTLYHIFTADCIWLARVLGAGQSGHPGLDFEEIATLREAWVSLFAEWKAWAETLSDAGALEVLSYRDLKGNPWQTQLWQIVLHVVNHATHHRGRRFLALFGPNAAYARPDRVLPADGLSRAAGICCK